MANKPLKKLRLFAHGEPLLNPRFIDMVEYAKKAAIAEKIELTTNATLLSESISHHIAEAGIDIINISINGIDSEQYFSQNGIRIEWESFIGKIRDLYEHRMSSRIFIKLSDIGYSEDQKRLFIKTFEGICDEIYIEGIDPYYWQDTCVAEKLPKGIDDHGLYGEKYSRKIVCTTVFTTMIINSQGQVKLCCTDWKNQNIVGDLTCESIDDVWNGEKLRRYQAMFLDRQRDSIPFCKNCQWPEMSTPDNVDEYIDLLKGRLRGKSTNASC